MYVFNLLRIFKVINITPEPVRPFSKITKAAIKRKRREMGKSRIYTDNPEKQRLQELYKKKELIDEKNRLIRRIDL